MSLAKIGGVGRRAHAVACALADALPRRTVVPGQLLKAERALEPRREIGSPERRLDRDRARAAHRVEQRRAGSPSAKREHARGEILAQRRDVGVPSPAALEQRLARRVEIERRLAFGQVGVHAHVRPLLVDRGSPTRVRAKSVADGVLHFQRRELDARKRRACRCDIDAQRARDREVPPPGDPLGQRVELVGVPVAAVRHLPEDSARETRLEVRVVRELDRPGERDATFGRRDERTAQGAELRRERCLQPARTGGEEALVHRSRRRRVSTSAT